MKFLVFTILLFFLACSSQEQKVVEEISSQTEIKPKIYRDENGNFINEDGWELPKKKIVVSTENITEIVDGKKLNRVLVRYELKERFFTENPLTFVNNQNFGMIELRNLMAFKGKNQKPYCYSSIAQQAKKDEETNKFVSFGVGFIYRLCDKDGDGKYETNPLKDFPIPDWVK